MSDNPRLKKWLDQVEEGSRNNPRSNKISEQQPTIIRQEIVYLPHGPIYVGFWRRFFAFLG